jgi:hypothetical protein
MTNELSMMETAGASGNGSAFGIRCRNLIPLRRILHLIKEGNSQLNGGARSRRE